MIEGFYFNVDKRILVLMLVHVGRNNEIGINSSTKILDAKKCSLCAYVYQVISLWCFVLIYQNIQQRSAMQEQKSESKVYDQLVQSIQEGNLGKVEEIVAKLPNIVNTTSADMKPPLYFAVLAQSDQLSEEMIKLLVRYGASINYKDSMDQTVLFYACREGKQKCAELLLSHGLNLDDPDQYGQTPLFYAASQNKLEIVKKYATKERVNHCDKIADQTPLYYSARKGHLEMSKLLVEKGADVAHLDHQNKTVVDIARKLKNTEVAEYLSQQLKRLREINKSVQISQSVEESNIEKKSINKKKEEHKPSRQTYKIVQYSEKGDPEDLTQQAVRNLFKVCPQLESYLANPESIPQELIDKSNAEHWQKQAGKVLTQCFRLKGSFWFQEPVDYHKLMIPDYIDIIPHPMDLGTVRKKLNHNCYSSVKEFAADMSLIWQNCYKYNGEEHDISKCAKEIENSFKEYYVSSGLNKYEDS